MKHFLKTINHIIFRPHNFYQNIDKHGIRETLKYLLIFALLTQLLLVYHYFFKGLPQFFEGLNLPIINLPFTWQNFILLYAATVVWVLFFNLIRPLLTHLFVRMFNRKALFRNTYKTIIYSNTPSYLMTPFYLSAVALLFTMIFLRNIWLFLLFIISAAFWIAGDAYAIYLKLLGFRKLHNLAVWKAFLCLYIFPMLFLLVLELIVLSIVFGVMILRNLI